MRSLIRKCRNCQSYTMREDCPNCGGFSDVALPPRYSPLDRFQRFRLKKEED